MPLKKYSELTKEQKTLVTIMFSDQTTIENYLYNFDDKGRYYGRQYNPPEGETKDGIHFGRLHIEVEEKSKKPGVISNQPVSNIRVEESDAPDFKDKARPAKKSTRGRATKK